MKKNLIIKNKLDQYTFHPEAMVFLTEHKVKQGKTSEHSFMIVPSVETFTELNEKFNIPESIMFVVKEYSPGNLFAYYNNLCQPNEKVLGEITATPGLLGDGVYVISEQDFLENETAENMIKQFNYERFGFSTNKDIIMVAKYFGYYYRVLNTEQKDLCKLITLNIPLDNIIVVLEGNLIYTT